QRITLAVGQQLNDINIALSPTQLSRISGTAVSSDGRPLTGGILTLLQTFGTGGFISSVGAQMKPDGSFTINGVTPGDYVLRAQVPVTTPGLVGEQIQANVTVNGED